MSALLVIPLMRWNSYVPVTFCEKFVFESCMAIIRIKSNGAKPFVDETFNTFVPARFVPTTLVNGPGMVIVPFTTKTPSFPVPMMMFVTDCAKTFGTFKNQTKEARMTIILSIFINVN